MGNCYGLGKKEIISDKSLFAVQNIIEYLKEDVIQRDIFRAPGHEGLSQQIARELGRGGKHLYRLLDDASVRDVASGLMIFFMFLKKPLIPIHIQAIVLDPDNKTVCPEIVAQDVLGLIHQEVHGRQLKLVQLILDLLNHVLKYTPTDELSGTNVPIYMMPIFFNLQAEHIMHWRRVATIFVEIIRLSPQYLNLRERASDNHNHLVVQTIRNDYSRVADNFLQSRMDDANFVLRRYLTLTGHRGDSLDFEVYVSTNHRRNHQEHIQRVF